jgi:tetratricopeptide (TPR) repeat protein
LIAIRPINPVMAGGRNGRSVLRLAPWWSTLLVLFLSLALASLAACSKEEEPKRGTRLLLDEANLLTDLSESIEQYLTRIREDYGIEVVLVTLPSIGADETLKGATSRLFTEWDIGRDYNGRGVLLMLTERDKEVRLEVGSALEHVFTDLFTGYIETKQLKSYYLSGQLEIGLIAVVEEIEARAQLVWRDLANEAAISSRDQKFLSAGGGADVDLQEFQAESITAQDRVYPAGSSPEEAWHTLIDSWRDKNRNPDIGVYTPITRLIYRDFTNLPDRRFEEDVRTWGTRPFEIISDDRYAVVFFGNKKGWDNAPFLFCRTEEGWQFDMVHQRKLVRMGRAPAWGIERGEHPYIALMSRCPYWMGQDIPLAETDVYSVANDNETAARILLLESRLNSGVEDFATIYELGRLYTITSMGQKRLSFLNRARSMQPDNPDVLKFLAVAHVDSHYQYETALPLMQRYVELRPEDSFGHFFLGYLYLMLDQPEQSIKALQKGLTENPDNIYGLCKLARAYHARGKVDDLAQASAILNRLQEIAPDHLRVAWLEKKLAS